MALRPDKNYALEQAFIADLDKLHYLLDGNVRRNAERRLDFRYVTPSHQGFVSRPTLKDKMHCVAYVVNGSFVDLDPDKIRREYQELLTLTSVRGIRVVIVVRNISSVCGEVKKNLRNVHRSVKIKHMVDKISDFTGMPISSIFLVETLFPFPFEETGKPSCRRDIEYCDTLANYVLQKMMDNARYYWGNFSYFPFNSLID